MPRISVVLPVYDESESIAACLRGLSRALEGHEHEILVCYDSDEDTTLPAIAAMPDRPPSIVLVKNQLGRGAANAIRAGFASARGDVVVTSMADLSDPPEVILEMADKIRAGADVVSGSRYMPGGSQSGGPLLKRTLSRLAGLSLHWIAGLRTRDATSNFRAYSRSFLERVAIESRQGFEIALELTVKAHLMGARVAEVPSSWVDRSAGQSRFRLWRWLHRYLRWWQRAVVEPALAWGAWLALAGSAVCRAWGSELSALANLAVVLVLALASAAALGLARSVRGRLRWVDLLHPILWLAPWHLGPLRAMTVAASALASAVVLATTCDRRGWARLGAAAREKFRRAIADLSQRGVGLAILCVLIWLSRMALPRQLTTGQLDSSWASALGQALSSRMQFGVDFLFNYGPLGTFSTSTYDAHLFWVKVLVWEVLVKGIIAVLLTRAALRIPGPFERTLWFLMLILLPLSPDAYSLLVLTAVAVLLLNRSGHLGTLLILTGAFVFAALALVKFTWLVVSAGCVVLVSVSSLRQGARSAGLGLLLACGGWFLVLWELCGQSLFALPSYLRWSAQLSEGHSEAMSKIGPTSTLWIGLFLFGLLILLALLSVFPGSRASARSRARWATGACLSFVAFVAFKTGFVRATDHAHSFLGYAAIASLLATTPAGVPRWRRATSALARLVVVVLGVAGLVVPVAETGGAGPRRAPDVVGHSLRRITDNLVSLLDLRRFQSEREEEGLILSIQNSLPATRARVGTDAIDMASFEQGLLFLNGLRWRPRPVCQGYLVYSPDLASRNAAFLEGPNAPRFVLFRAETIDGRLTTMDDGLALQVLARDWQPVLEENGLLLLVRRPRNRADDSSGPPQVVLERTVAFGERIDLPVQPEADGACHVLSLDIRYTLLGQLMKTIFRAPPLFLSVEVDSGESAEVRIIPGMMRTGVILDPWVPTQHAWIEWMTGQGKAERRLPRPISVRVPPSDFPWMYEPSIGLKLERRNGLAPSVDPAFTRNAIAPSFVPAPDGIQAASACRLEIVDGREMLVAPAPSAVRYDLRPGDHVIRGRFGLFDAPPVDHDIGGASFSVTLEEKGAARQILLDRRLDLGFQDFELRFHNTRPARLHLLASFGSGGDRAAVRTAWGSVELDPAGPVEPR